MSTHNEYTPRDIADPNLQDMAERIDAANGWTEDSEPMTATEAAVIQAAEAAETDETQPDIRQEADLQNGWHEPGEKMPELTPTQAMLVGLHALRPLLQFFNDGPENKDVARRVRVVTMLTCPEIAGGVLGASTYQRLADKEGVSKQAIGAIVTKLRKRFPGFYGGNMRGQEGRDNMRSAALKNYAASKNTERADGAVDALTVTVTE